ncbi:hypothetical protein HDV05_002350, partial [Chytridiales sp. JEL 0842]
MSNLGSAAATFTTAPSLPLPSSTTPAPVEQNQTTNNTLTILLSLIGAAGLLIILGSIYIVFLRPRLRRKQLEREQGELYFPPGSNAGAVERNLFGVHGHGVVAVDTFLDEKHKQDEMEEKELPDVP